MNIVHSLLIPGGRLARKIDPAKREAILKSARKLFAELGVEKTTIARIASDAGLATGTVYLYFDSKIKIVAALVDSYLMESVRVTGPAFDLPDAEQAIEQGVHASLQLACENADLVRLIDMRRSTAGKTESSDADKAVQRNLRQVLARHAANGSSIRYNPVVLAELISGMLEWVSKVCFVWSDVDPMRYEATLVQLFKHALLKDYKEEER
jgi:AcrR family transcriptional regulator